MQVDRALADLTFAERLNFLLTNRIPRQAATRFMGWFSKIENPLVRSISIGAWKLFVDDLRLHEAKKSTFNLLPRRGVRRGNIPHFKASRPEQRVLGNPPLIAAAIGRRRRALSRPVLHPPWDAGHGPARTTPARPRKSPCSRPCPGRESRQPGGATRDTARVPTHGRKTGSASSS